MRVKKCFSVLVFLNLLFVFHSNAQNFTIDINDNVGLQYQNNIYHITQDSLTINGKSDYGRTNVNYLQRRITASEEKHLQRFLKSFPADSLQETYFSDYNNFSYISAENFPRVIEVKIESQNKIYVTKATNAYVRLLAELFSQINFLFPPEVNIKYDKSKFNAMY